MGWCNLPGATVLYFVHILRCADDSYYVGHCIDVAHRLSLHNNGEGAKHTREHRPVVLVYTEEFRTEADAVRRERQIKRWSRAKKEALIRRDVAALKALARRQT
jgi:predicted GIY-YIG superfamily endonuclease